MYRLVFYIIVVTLLVGCSISSQTTPDLNAVATEVAIQLTAQVLSSPNPEESMPTPTNSLLPPAQSDTPTSTPTLEFTSTPSIEPSLTSTPTATATVPPTDPREMYGVPAWQDDFSSGRNFYLFDDGNTRTEVLNGSFVMTGFTPYWMGWSLTYPKIKNFYLEATVNVGACAGFDRYGLAFRTNDPSNINGYLFSLACNGQYALSSFTNGTETSIVGWRDSNGTLLGSGNTNRIGVLAQGNQFTLYINGKEMHTAQADFYQSGSFGFFINPAQTSGFKVEYDTIAYWLIQ